MSIETRGTKKYRFVTWHKGMNIYFGSNDKYRLEKATVAKVHLHPKWSNKTLRSITRNDVAILTLTKPIKFTNKVKPICLPAKSSEYNEGYGYATTAGWGFKEKEPSRK